VSKLMRAIRLLFREMVSYCLSEPAVEQCRPYGNFLLVLVVVATNAVQIIALAIVILF
jgi:hypothetical protein